jgi:predicted dehydrogenase
MDNLGGSMILGSEGGVKLDPFGYFFSLGAPRPQRVRQHERVRLAAAQRARSEGDAYDGPQQHWIAALQGRVPLIPSAACALNTMLISEGIYLSERLGREVTPEDVLAHSHSTARPI